MAGRPVTSRGGLTGVHYGMVVFAFLAVVFLGLSIFLLTRVKGAEEAAARAEQRSRLHGSPPTYYADEARARGSNAFAVMSADLASLANLVTGARDQLAPTVLANAQRVLDDIARRKPDAIRPGDTLLTALEQLDALHTRKVEEAAALSTALDDLQSETAALTAQLKAKEDQFTAEVETLSRQLAQSEQEKVAALRQKDEQLGDLQATLDAREQQIQQLRREGSRREQDLELEINRLQNQIASLQQEIKDFKLSFDPTAILTKADGRVLRAIPGSDIVYINLGAADKVKVGMGFEVFSQTGELPDGLSGKASLEVVTVMEDTSECRVTRRSPARPIIEGDIVVNIAFERGRQPKFVIRGDFDLNYDGVVDYDGLDQVAAIIRQWGGQVVDELDESVDFVVIGLPPTIPTFARGAQVSPAVRDQTLKAELQLSAFRALVDKAQKMFIPVITQNQFLFLTGYAGEGAIVRR